MIEGAIEICQMCFRTSAYGPINHDYSMHRILVPRYRRTTRDAYDREMRVLRELGAKKRDSVEIKGVIA